MMTRWENKDRGDMKADYFYTGDLVFAMVVKQRGEERPWHYSVKAVFTKFITKGHGNVTTRETAKKAVERAFRDWCDHAGLQVKAGEVV